MINKPTTLFNCSCMADGLTVTVEKDDLDGKIEEPFINIAFWECLIKYRNDKLTWKNRLRIIWYAIRGILPYTDMVSFDVKTAKHFAYHILYLIQKNKKVNEEVVDTGQYEFKIPKGTADTQIMTGSQAVEEMTDYELGDLNLAEEPRMENPPNGSN